MNVGPVVMANPSLLVYLKQGNYTPLASLCALKQGPRYRFGEMTAAPDQKYFQTLLRHLGSLHETQTKAELLTTPLNYHSRHQNAVVESLTCLQCTP